ncbi:MAG: hypothetical protein Q8L37_00965 [Candidatus Gottesmanbacteria bacterium]|nr:hypothetical protein [Candidatus Gottesmanbacteria bacterium]
MPQQESSIVNDIVEYIHKTNTLSTDWYVGIAENAQARLFEEHGVNKDMDYWIYRECVTADAARRVERYFITNYQTDGGSGGGSDESRFVYAYKKERHTREGGM